MHRGEAPWKNRHHELAQPKGVSVMRARLARALAVAGAGALVLTACGGGDDGGAEETSAADGQAEEIVTDVGVTEEPRPDAVNEDNGCIYLGILSDLSEGPFAALAVPIVEAQQDFWQRVNEDGGISGYDVDVTEYTRDTKYDPQTHSQAYREIEPSILALAQTLGTPTTQAILSDMDADNVIGAPASWWSGWQFEETDSGLILESGHSYCIEAMVGLDWFAENKAEPTNVLAIGYPGDYGGDFAAGAEKWAEANDVEFSGFVETGPNAVVGTQDAAVAQVLSSGADVVALGVGPAETAEIVGKAAAGGYTGQFLGAVPTANPALLQTAAAPALLGLYTHVGTHEGYDGTSAAHEAMRAARGDDPPPNDGYTFGWMWQYPILAALEAAAANGDLTREGLRSVVDGLEVDFEGALPNVTLGEEVDRTATISVFDEEATTGLSAVDVGISGPTADAYEYTAACAG
jgi:ABC-type branched-subunit amino acid transport system substrate-binding protein